MNVVQPGFIYLGLLFIAILLSGFWVSRLGKPYNTLVFTLHKLIGLGLGTWLVKIVYDRTQLLALPSSQTSILALTVILFAITVVAGGLLSIQAEGGLKSFPPVVWRNIERVHQFFPYLILVSTALLLYRLFQ